MRQQKDLSAEKQIERLQRQIVKFGDPKRNPTDKYGIKRQIIEDLRDGTNGD